MIEIEEINRENIENFKNEFETIIKEAMNTEINSILQDMEKLVNVIKQYKNN